MPGVARFGFLGGQRDTMTSILSSGSVADVNWPHPEFLPGRVALINSALSQKLPGDEDPPRAQFKNKAAVVE